MSTDGSAIGAVWHENDVQFAGQAEMRLQQLVDRAPVVRRRPHDHDLDTSLLQPGQQPEGRAASGDEAFRLQRPVPARWSFGVRTEASKIRLPRSAPADRRWMTSSFTFSRTMAYFLPRDRSRHPGGPRKMRSLTRVLPTGENQRPGSSP